MTRLQYAMLMFTQVVILGKVSPVNESGMWEAVTAAWFIAMVINLVAQLIDYGKNNKSN